MPSPLLEKSGAIIFDIDGTLVDTSYSYTEVIKETVYRTLSQSISGSLADVNALVSSTDIAALKHFGGFNNDWDTVSGLVAYFLDLGNSRSFPELAARKNLPAWIEWLRQTGQHGLPAVYELVSPKTRALLKNEGSLVDTNEIQRLYQELYQGGDYFKATYGLDPVFYQGPGYYERETLLVDLALLKSVADTIPLAIATGRIRAEAEMVLDRFGIRDCFNAIVADDDIPSAHRKPSPEILYAVVDALNMNARFRDLAYLGDLPDDIRAANAAKAKLNIFSVAVGLSDPSADLEFPDVNAFLRELQGVGHNSRHHPFVAFGGRVFI
jgi:HAD superfamily hydrolase (TIGR01548 family)